jgi:lysyl-tRNA synthetase class 2
MTEEKKPQQQKKQAQQHVPAVEPDINEQMQNRIDKMQQMVERGIAPFGHKYLWTHHAKDVDAQADKLEADGTEVKVCGRLMAIRGHGKACFADMMDKTGRLQLYLRKDVLGDEPYATVKLLDIGDIVGAAGTVFKTHSGEISVRVNKLDVLSKSLRPLPEKWHGLKDVELRYRQRYVDLIV